MVVNQFRCIWRLEWTSQREDWQLKLYLQKLRDLEAQKTRLCLFCVCACVCVSLADTSVFMRPLSKHLLSLLYSVKALIYGKRGAF